MMKELWVRNDGKVAETEKHARVGYPDDYRMTIEHPLLKENELATCLIGYYTKKGITQYMRSLGYEKLDGWHE